MLLFDPIQYDPHSTKRRSKATKSQQVALESTFLMDPKPHRITQEQLAAQLGMSLRSVQIWFQNRRAKARHRSTAPVPEFSIAYLVGYIPETYKPSHHK
ncbi:hypothetical protein DSO57_1007589 [Entomophthora muscae]|uniref:Uncharacterized protein n=2 Tax=Entomophthora muscae TaxID=34485 RepID=A0ACC2RGC2_9FUNG|nr:hypothetical protein DSO57_1028488 [Entomophthora muscae]KAJ9055097.1 hypothetical protein DSO57_1007589 [Entomophthora muscae]